ncbi:threonylcarbamoyl-AMP synthase [Calonectris borealis]|uniref:threonylcarbamoyl-AMP synthase n=1 Tax=Calonectris borealis TaxID=1323832 RepID=UPI003F4BE04D
MRARRCRCRASSRLRSLRSSSSPCGGDSGHGRRRGPAGPGRAAPPVPPHPPRAGRGAPPPPPSRPAQVRPGPPRPASPRERRGRRAPGCASPHRPLRAGSGSCMLSARRAGLARAGEGAPGPAPGLGRACSARLLLLPPPSGAAQPDPQGAGGCPRCRAAPLTRWCRAGWREAVTAAAGALQAGGLVAVPTDTVYGVACLAQDSGAVRSIYSLKGRNGEKPLAICLGDVDRLYRYCHVNVPDELLRDLLPGPVTLVLKRSEELNKDLNPFTSLVGVRVPNHPFIRELARACSGPLALTSANISCQASTLTVSEFQDLWPQLSLIIDGGPIGDVQSPECRLGSTVVDLSVSGKFTIIRPGCALTSTVEILRQKYGLVPESS